MTNLFETWVDAGTTIEEMAKFTKQELRDQVKSLYISGTEWQQDGTIDEVTEKLWNEIHS